MCFAKDISVRDVLRKRGGRGRKWFNKPQVGAKRREPPPTRLTCPIKYKYKYLFNNSRQLTWPVKYKEVAAEYAALTKDLAVVAKTIRFGFVVL